MPEQLGGRYDVGLWLERKLRQKDPRLPVEGDGARELDGLVVLAEDGRRPLTAAYPPGVAVRERVVALLHEERPAKNHTVHRNQRLAGARAGENRRAPAADRAGDPHQGGRAC